MSRSIQAVAAEMRQKIAEAGPEELAESLRAAPAIVLDIREEDELAEGIIPGAVHVPRGILDIRIERLIPDRRADIVLYCAGGIRSVLAAGALQEMGYSRVVSLAGGFRAWQESGLPIDRAGGKAASDPVSDRYSRHLRIPEVGAEGQRRLASAKVLLVGVGGLGAPAAMYLAAAGIGTLGLVDDDVVEVSNLQRQVIHSMPWVGMPKVDSAAFFIRNFNPSVKVRTYPVRLDASNVLDLMGDYDLIVDGTDNFPARYLINDACVKLGKPCIHASIHRFEGQLTLFAPADGGPCYRCLYPEPPPRNLAPSCAEAGVLGVLPGVMGLLQSVEAVKRLLGIGRGLQGRLLAYDALQSTFGEFELDKDPLCPACSKEAGEIALVDQALDCAAR